MGDGGGNGTRGTDKKEGETFYNREKKVSAKSRTRETDLKEDRRGRGERRTRKSKV